MQRTLFMSIWVVNSLAIAFVPAVMLARKTFKVHPMFFAYVLYQAIFAWVALITWDRMGHKLTFYAFWISTCGWSNLWGSWSYGRSFLNIFRPYDSLREFGNVLFRWSSVVLVIIATVMALTSESPGYEPHLQFPDDPEPQHPDDAVRTSDLHVLVRATSWA